MYPKCFPVAATVWLSTVPFAYAGVFLSDLTLSPQQGHRPLYVVEKLLAAPALYASQGCSFVPNALGYAIGRSPGGPEWPCVCVTVSGRSLLSLMGHFGSVSPTDIGGDASPFCLSI